MVPSPTALFVGHPGHELRLLHWLEHARPVISVLTDGSGGGSSRIASTLDVLSMTGCRAGALMGRFTDQDVYDSFLARDAGALADATVALAGEFVELGVRSVVADAFELYNPTHDLCSVMATLATLRAQEETGQPIARYAYAVMQPSAAGPALVLDDEMLQRKLAIASRFADLAADVAGLVSSLGMDGLRREVLEPVALSVDLQPLTGKPFYEVRGEQQVAAGKYRTVLRYEEHFVPFVQELIAQTSRMATPRLVRDRQ